MSQTRQRRSDASPPKISFDPYLILGLESNAPLKEVRAVFKQLVLRHHPDKGGDAVYFDIITKAYQCILNQHREKTKYQDKINQPVRHEQYNPEMDGTMGMESLDVNPKNFCRDKFNRIFEEVRVRNQLQDRGYGEEDFEAEDLGSLEPRGKIGQDEFNRRFSLHKQKYTQDVIVHKDPEPLYNPRKSALAGNNFFELGQEEISDYSSSMSNGLEGTDYKKAYGKESKLIEPEMVKPKQYRNISQLEQERSNLDYKMNADQERLVRIREDELAEQERRRLERLQRYDSEVERNYQQINRRLIGGGR